MVQLIIIVDLFIYVQAQITLSPFYYFNFLNTFKYIFYIYTRLSIITGFNIF
jgi:hypothetical protein